jgi:hypothetical protein
MQGDRSVLKPRPATRSRLRSAVATGVLALVAAGSASAHHALTVIDRNKTVELSGVVKSWEWTNPHTWLTLSVQQKGSKAQEWALEGLAPGTLRLKNWSRLMMKAGDRVTVTMHPRRDGTAGGMLVNVVLPDGRFFAGFSGSPPTSIPADQLKTP